MNGYEQQQRGSAVKRIRAEMLGYQAAFEERVANGLIAESQLRDRAIRKLKADLATDNAVARAVVMQVVRDETAPMRWGLLGRLRWLLFGLSPMLVTPGQEES